ncbi:MAG TPA: hypothetical protein VE570_06015 [Thermoleophilaceae bacterium]|jgi:hypothetical protein|nr:hypothetical protein [Thermoleophilaceae bacterium]
MTRRVRRTLLLALGATLALAPAAQAAHGCHVRGTKVFARSRYGVVLLKRRYDRNINRVAYGCLFRKGAVYRLNLPGDEGLTYIEKPIVITSRYVAYVSDFDLPDGGDDLYITVRDLINGKVIHNVSDTRANDGYPYPVYRIVVNRHGSVAWISDAPDNGYEVDEAGTGDLPKVVDKGKDIAPESLRLSPDGQTISWIDAGTPRSARLD